jgi:hypothetical protein
MEAEKLPFNVERFEDHLVVSSKNSQRAHNRLERRKNHKQKNKNQINVELFDNDYFDRMARVRADLHFPITFADFAREIRIRVISLLTR